MTNQSFCYTFHVASDETAGKLLTELGNGQWDIPALSEALKRVRNQNESLQDFEVAHLFPQIGRRVMLLNAQRLRQDTNTPSPTLLAMEDVTDRPTDTGAAKRRRE